MSIEVNWDNREKTVIRFDYTARWSWQDYYAALDETKSWVENLDYKVYFINKVDNIGHLPANAVNHFKKTAVEFGPYVHLTVIVAHSRFLHLVFDVFQRVAGEWSKNYRFVESMEEAYALIADYQQQNLEER